MRPLKRRYPFGDNSVGVMRAQVQTITTHGAQRGGSRRWRQPAHISRLQSARWRNCSPAPARCTAAARRRRWRGRVAPLARRFRWRALPRRRSLHARFAGGPTGIATLARRVLSNFVHFVGLRGARAQLGPHAGVMARRSPLPHLSPHGTASGVPTLGCCASTATGRRPRGRRRRRRQRNGAAPDRGWRKRRRMKEGKGDESGRSVVGMGPLLGDLLITTGERRRVALGARALARLSPAASGCRSCGRRPCARWCACAPRWRPCAPCGPRPGAAPCAR